MIRVGVVTTSYPREPGDGAGAFVAGFARWLVEAGAAVEVVAAGPGAAHVDGIPVARVDGRRLFFDGGAPDALARGAASWLRAATFSTELAAAVARRFRRWDAVVSHWVAPSGLVASTVAPRLPHLAIAHSSDVTLLSRRAAGRRALTWLSRRADLVYAAPHLARLVDGAPGRVVPMGIDRAALGPAADEDASTRAAHRAAARRRLGLALDGEAALPDDGRRLTALFLGRLVPVKGIDLLVDAVAPLDAIDLLVAGDGPLAASLAARVAALPAPARRRVHLLGEVRAAARADVLAAADLLVIPSRALLDGRAEGTPTVLFEARACGLPVLATSTGGLPAAITDGVDGLLAAPTVPSLRAALARLATDDALRLRLAAAARRLGPSHDWREVGPRLAGQTICVRTPLRSA